MTEITTLDGMVTIFLERLAAEVGVDVTELTDIKIEQGTVTIGVRHPTDYNYRGTIYREWSYIQ